MTVSFGRQMWRMVPSLAGASSTEPPNWIL
jgi:hypothetical protein